MEQTPFNTICVLRRVLIYAVPRTQIQRAVALTRVSKTFLETIRDWFDAFWISLASLIDERRQLPSDDRTASAEIHEVNRFFCRLVRTGTPLWVLESLLSYSGSGGNDEDGGHGCTLLKGFSEYAKAHNRQFDPLLQLPVACSLALAPNNVELIKLLVRGGCNVNRTVELFQMTPLLVALQSSAAPNRTEIVALLCALGADVNKRGFSGLLMNITPLCALPKLAATELSEAGRSLSMARSSLYTLRRRNQEKGQDLDQAELERQEQELEAAERELRLVQTAIKRQYARLFKILVDNGADVNLIGAGDEITPALAAARDKQHFLLKFLLDRGASPDASFRCPHSWRRTTIQMLAADSNDQEMMRIVLLFK